MKTCTKCGIEKDESEFNKAKQYKDGLRYECKDCWKQRMRDTYRKYRAERMDRSVAYYWKHREHYLEQRRDNYKKNRERELANMAKRRDPEKNHARNQANWRLILKDRCEICGAPAKEKHHPDYSQPLYVWHLCLSCHRRVHSRGITIGKAAGSPHLPCLEASGSAKPS